MFQQPSTPVLCIWSILNICIIKYFQHRHGRSWLSHLLRCQTTARVAICYKYPVTFLFLPRNILDVGAQILNHFQIIIKSCGRWVIFLRFWKCVRYPCHIISISQISNMWYRMSSRRISTCISKRAYQENYLTDHLFNF